MICSRGFAAVSSLINFWTCMADWAQAHRHAGESTRRRARMQSAECDEAHAGEMPHICSLEQIASTQ